MNKVYHLEEISSFKQLPRDGKFFYRGKRVIVDLYTDVVFYYEVFSERIVGMLRFKEKEVPLAECEALFPGWYLYGGVLRMLPAEVDWKWVELVYPTPKAITGKQFFKTLEKGLPGMPEVVWRERPHANLVEALPFLILKDRTGAFADLWMDYGEIGQIAFHDPISFPERVSKVEKDWQRDLLETDFKPKLLENSHYYCPLDKVGKSLSFLLEVGWKVLDHRGKRVYLQGSQQLELTDDGHSLYLAGTLSYASHQAPLESVIGAFHRRERFVDLTPDAVGLIEPMKQWEELSLEREKIRVPKTHFALLESFLERPEIKKDAAAEAFIHRMKGSRGIQEMPPAEEFCGVLYPYQRAGLNWLFFLYQSGFNGLLADEMGLGKTIQLIALLSHIPKSRAGKLPILIVMPTSLLFNWKRELQRFLPSRSVYLHAGEERCKEIKGLEMSEIILTSYALLRVDRELFQQMTFATVFLDEAQLIKNPESKVAQVAFSLKAAFKMAITGTPVENKWEDLWSLFHFLMPDLLGERALFDFERAKLKLKPFILRRKKEEVASDLPEKVEQEVLVEMTESQRALYDGYLQKIKGGLLKTIEQEGIQSHRMEILEAILRLRQICAHPGLADASFLNETSGKLDQLFSDLEGVVESGRKALVYSQFTTMLRMIEQKVIARGWGYVYLDGSTKEREKVVQQFQSDSKTSLFLISLKAGGVGLNLTAADYVFLYDPWWNEAVERQAIDRAHRLGRNEIVIAKRYTTVSSIEEKMVRLKEHKRRLAETLLETGEELSEMTLNDLYELLSSSMSS
jgi:superfamily II DNA or RNA helicase